MPEFSRAIASTADSLLDVSRSVDKEKLAAMGIRDDKPIRPDRDRIRHVVNIRDIVKLMFSNNCDRIRIDRRLGLR
jgi:hypothetical protein